MIFKPFRGHDRIKFRDNFVGIEEDITLRHTIIRDMENNRVVVPNSVIGNEVLINLHLGDSRVCKVIDVSVRYSPDINHA